MLSYITLKNKPDWKNDNFLSLCGLSIKPIEYITQTNPHIKNIILCLDNDKAGNNATANFTKQLTDKGYIVKREIPVGKDFNEELVGVIKKPT